jgi:hypothetical protein
MYVLCSKSHSSLFVYVSMGAVGTRCCPALLLTFLLICYLLLCSCSEQSRLKSLIPVQNMLLCFGIQFFFAYGGPLLGTLVATTLLSKCFSRYFRPWYMVISLSCWSWQSWTLTSDLICCLHPN